MTTTRKASIARKTNETDITVDVDLDGSGKGTFETGVPLLEHMLDQIARHGLIDLNIKAIGDLEIDERIRRLDRQRLLVSDGLHAWSPWWAIACHLTCRAGVLLASTVKTGN